MRDFLIILIKQSFKKEDLTMNLLKTNMTSFFYGYAYFD